MPEPREKGKQMDHDAAYANAAHIPDGDSYPDRWAEAAATWREREALAGRLRLNQPYGAAAREGLDLFLPAGRPEGLVLFMHGGFWRAFDRRGWSHLSAGCTARGWAVAIPSYTLTPEASIAAITRQTVAALEHAAGMVRGPIVAAGHSAGGHLVARLACADLAVAPDVLARLRHVVPISPLSDLRPLMHTRMNEDFRLNADQAAAESPVLCRPRDIAVTVWVGAEERPAFLDQAMWLDRAWPRARLHIAPGRHHFDVIDPLADPDSDLVEVLLAEA